MESDSARVAKARPFYTSRADAYDAIITVCHCAPGYRRAVTDFATLPADLPAPEDDGAASHLPGMTVPHVALDATGGDRVAIDRLGSGRSIVYIYPLSGRPGIDQPGGWDDIPGARGCTPEACSFRDHYADLRAAGASHVYGLSRQDHDYQRELVERLHLPFEMLADPDGLLGASLDLPQFEADGRSLYKRLTLVLRDGVIEHVFYPVFPPDTHAVQVLEWLRDNPIAERGLAELQPSRGFTAPLEIQD